MKILITGSSGYVGYVLAKYFSEKGIQVIGLDIASNPVWKGNEHFAFYTCDVTNQNRLDEIFSKELPTHVIHLAYLMDPLYNAKKEYDIDVNGSKYVFQKAHATESVRQFIQFSSASTYGAWPDNPQGIKESQSLRPRDYRYAINKKIVEEYLNNFKKREDFKLVTVRMCTAIGPLYHKKGGVVSILANARVLPKFKGRYCELQFLHEDDLTSIIELMLLDLQVSGTFNLAPDSYASIKELAPTASFFPLPLGLMRGLIRTLWAIQLVRIMPAALTLSTYGIVVDPEKLMQRYNYTFKHSTLSGFQNTVAKRKSAGNL